ncbi:hypothetical protein PENTCL1PPCAC_6650, partial [Pristionchus entomophagus]
PFPSPPSPPPPFLLSSSSSSYLSQSVVSKMEKIEISLFALLFAALGYCMYLIQEKNKKVDALNDKIAAASLRRKQKQRTRSIRKRLGSMEDLTSTNTSLTSVREGEEGGGGGGSDDIPFQNPSQKKPSTLSSLHNNSAPTNNHPRRSKSKI